jgi:hypothetical protein
MPLDTIDPPMAAYETVRTTLSDLAGQGAFRTPALRRAEPASLAISTPHRLAVLGLNRIPRARDLRSVVEFKGWRFLVHDRTRVVAAADALEVEGKRYRLGQLNEGPFVAGTEDAIRRAENLDQVRRGRFLPVFLLVPAVYVAALWLENQQGKTDVVIVMPPAPKEFKEWVPMSTAPFLAGLRRLAALVPAEGKQAEEPSGG